MPEHDGLPLGQFSLNMVWPQVTIVEAEEVAGPDRFNGRFSNKQSPLAEFAVQEGPNTIPPLALKTR